MYDSCYHYPHFVCRPVPCRLVTRSFFRGIHNHLSNWGSHSCAVYALIHQYPVQPVTAAGAVCCGRPTKHRLPGHHWVPPDWLPPVCCSRAGCACTAAGSQWHSQPATGHRWSVYYCLPFPRPGRQSLAAERTLVTSILIT